MNIKWTQVAPTEFVAKWLETDLKLVYEKGVEKAGTHPAYIGGAWRLYGAEGKKCALKWPSVASAMDAVDAEVERQLRVAALSGVTAVQKEPSTAHIVRKHASGRTMPHAGAHTIIGHVGSTKPNFKAKTVSVNGRRSVEVGR